MNNKTKSKKLYKVFLSILILFTLVAGAMSVFAILSEDSTKLATGSLVTINSGSPLKPLSKVQQDEFLSYCERVKLSQLKYNYDQVIFTSNDPEKYREEKASLVKYNYGTASLN
ncbi:MAG: hypothetical protein Q8O89_02190 [Nanoarchaeota archaeon]|nr:hypothetical protein [Nanoarchaeota archaeon]